MQTSEIMIINRLATGTAFAATVTDNQNVFIPAKVAASLDAQVGQRFTAILIANTAHPDRTPWMAIRIDPHQVSPVADELGKLILDDLSKGGMATVEEVADAVGEPVTVVVAKMQEMARAGLVKRRTFYAASDADFNGEDE